MPATALVTGGAGFIGRALTRRLLDRYDRVVAVDSLLPQVHPGGAVPADLDPRVELVVADVADPGAWDTLLATQGTPAVVVHLAAETGTAQSLTESTRHATTNVVGTTAMLDAFTRRGARPDTLVLASSRAVYGEGPWRDEHGTVVLPGPRTHAMLADGIWDFPGLTPVPVADTDVEPRPSSVYAATKLAQEHLLTVWGSATGADVRVLRLQNVYGPGQPPTNPYTGILPLFARVAAAGEAIPVFEDGRIVRDFVHVEDVSEALELALTVPPWGSGPVDIGSGEPVTLLDIARRIAGIYQAPEPVVTGQFRDGDVRYACADTGAAARRLGWRPQREFDTALAELVAAQPSDRR